MGSVKVGLEEEGVVPLVRVHRHPLHRDAGGGERSAHLRLLDGVVADIARDAEDEMALVAAEDQELREARHPGILEKIEAKEAPTKLEAEIVSEPKWWKRNVDVKVEVKQEGLFAVVNAIFTLGEKLIEFLSKWHTLPFLVRKVDEDFNIPQKVVITDPKTGVTLTKEDIQGDVLVNLQSASGPDKIRVFDSKRKIIDPAIDSTLAVQVAEDSGDSNLLYVGEADPNTATSASAWRIKLIDSTTGVIITWADGDTNFDNKWDDRESLTYT